MALIEGNFTSDFRTPGGTSTSFSHTQNTGSDGALVVFLTSYAYNVSSITYGGQSLTLVEQSTPSIGNDKWSVWEITSPPTGSNTLTITYGGPIWDTVSSAVYSFTGSGGVGNWSVNNTGAVDQTTNVTISNNSMIVGVGISQDSSISIEIPTGTAVPADWNHNIGQTIKGGISPSLTSGSKEVKAQTGWGAAVIKAVEITEASAPPPTRRRIIIC